MKFILFLIAMFLSGCMESSVRQYDPNEVIVRGIVVTKYESDKQDVEKELKRIRKEEIMSAAVRNIATLGFGVVVIPVGSSTEVPGKPTQYDVDLENGNKVRLYSGHSGFQEGDCVAIFLNDDWEEFPPRMAYGQESCSDTSTVNSDGTVTTGGTTSMSGFTIIEAESMEAALLIAKACHFLDIGGSLEVSELIQMPGQE